MENRTAADLRKNVSRETSARRPDSSTLQNNPMHQKICQLFQLHSIYHFVHFAGRLRRRGDRIRDLRARS
jgi:hypothetical protein